MNNPVKYNDPTGHCVGAGGHDFPDGSPACESQQTNDPIIKPPQLPCEGISGPYGTMCNNFNQAFQIIYNPKATFGQKLGAGYYVSVSVSAHGGVVVGTVWAAWELLIPTGVACAESPQCQQAGYNTFTQLKNAIGSPGEGNVWHHIVEQSQIIKSGFSPQQINSLENIIAVDKTIHAQISGFYSSIRPFTDGMIVRNWLANQSFQQQYEFGLQVLRDFGILK